MVWEKSFDRVVGKLRRRGRKREIEETEREKRSQRGRVGEWERERTPRAVKRATIGL